MKLGSKHTPETCKKMSKSAMGNTSGLGRVVSDYEKEQSRIRALGNKYALGHTLSDETKAILRVKTSKRMIGNTYTLGRKQPLDEVKRRADANRGKKRTPEQCKNISDGNIGKPKHNKESREKIRKGGMGNKNALGHKLSEHKPMCQCSGCKVCRGERDHLNMPRHSRLEYNVFKILESLYKDDWIHNVGKKEFYIEYDGGHIKHPDIYHRNKKITIECNGVHWHTTKRNRTREEEEIFLRKLYSDHGFTCIIIWEDDYYKAQKKKQFIKDEINKQSEIPICHL